MHASPLLSLLLIINNYDSALEDTDDQGASCIRLGAGRASKIVIYPQGSIVVELERLLQRGCRGLVRKRELSVLNKPGCKHI